MNKVVCEIVLSVVTANRIVFSNVVTGHMFCLLSYQLYSQLKDNKMDEIFHTMKVFLLWTVLHEMVEPCVHACV